tara:strand:+ start:683 stop:931 length:249 start_codon:yes stop_codon:yes gene_type:complete
MKFDIDNICPFHLGLERHEYSLSADGGKNYFQSLTKKEYDQLLIDVQYWIDCGNYEYTNVEEAFRRVLENADIQGNWWRKDY